MKSTYIKIISVLCLVGALASLSSCTCSKSKNRQKMLSAVSGKAGEVIIVTSKTIWNSEVGDSLRSVLTADYPFLPQPEPSFKLVNITPDDFSDAFRIHRNLVIVEIGDANKEAKLSSQTDLWASTQMVIKVSGPDIASVTSLINKERNRIWMLLEQAEINRQTDNARKYSDAKLRDLVEKKFGITLFIPDGYDKMKDEPNFAWFEYKTNFASLGIFVYDYPYKDTAQFSQKVLTEKRDEFLKKHVPASRDSSYMITSPYETPEYTPLTYKGKFLGRLRGLWEVHNDYMGGPFVSYSQIVNGNIVTVEGYVYAPKTEKRNYVRQMIGILLTVVPDKPAETSTSEEKK